MKSVMEYFKGSKKTTAPVEPGKQEVIEKNPTNLEARVMQVRDITAKRKKMLDDMDK